MSPSANVLSEMITGQPVIGGKTGFRDQILSSRSNQRVKPKAKIENL